jgi:hypothetical protein
VNYELLVTVVGFLGTLIGVASVLVAQRLQWKQDRRAGGEDEVKRAVEELVVHARSLDLAAHAAASTAVSFMSLGGMLNRLIGIVTPLDPPALLEGMNTRLEALNRAAARLQITQDQRTVELANEVMLAAASVIHAHNQVVLSARTWPVRAVVRVFLAGEQAADPAAAVAEARSSLSKAVRALCGQTRTQLKHPRVDLWAEPEPLAMGPGHAVEEA